ncbi:MAG: hypothetical protein WCK05_05505 [Planctomycetota bacterium]
MQGHDSEIRSWQPLTAVVSEGFIREIPADIPGGGTEEVTTLRTILGKALPYVLASVFLLPVAPAALASGKADSLMIQTRYRVESPAGGGQLVVKEAPVEWNPRETAIIVVDMWDNHHCKAAARRVAELAPAMNEVLKAARAKGILIVHSPADCMDFYKDAAQRKRAESAPAVQPPSPITLRRRDPRIEPAYPDELTRDGEFEGNGACSGCEPRCPLRERNWTRQIAAIEISEPDVISDVGQEVYNLFRQRGIRHVIVMGVHTNICVLHRPTGIRNLRFLGFDIVLCRDLTDSFYEPKTPADNHFRGNALIIEHIEKYLCPTINSTALTGKPPFRFAGDAAAEASLERTPTPKPFTSLDEAAQWLHAKASSLIRASRTPMPNGVSAFPPQAGAGYEAFWLRDYAYQLEGCIEAFSDKELRQSCQVFVKALRADGAGVDCVKFDGTPIYMPGYGSMGANPVADGSQFTVEVAWYTYQKTKDDQLLKEVLDKLVETMDAAPRNPATGLIHIKAEGWDRCPYGFTDSIRKQGDELFCSLLYVQACRQLADLMEAGNRPEDAKKWRSEAEKLLPVIRKTFWDGKTGLFLATTGLCNQPDIWGSAFAVYLDVASAQQAKTIAAYFKDHYGQIVQKGQIRHLPGGLFWQAGCDPNTYQNGGFWATPTGWFVYTLDLVDPKLADQTVIDLVNDFRERGVSEWVLGDHLAVMNYLAIATMPLAGVRRMMDRRGKSLVFKEIVEELPGGLRTVPK